MPCGWPARSASRCRCAAEVTTSRAGRRSTSGLMIDLSPMKGIHVDAARAHGARPGRRPVEGAQPRDTAAWARDDRRRRREHGDRRPDARRRTRLADAEVRPRARQPAGRRDGDGRRPRGPRERRREPGSVLGDSRRRRQLRHRRVARVHAASGRADDHRRCRGPSVARALSTCCASSAIPARRCPTRRCWSPRCRPRPMVRTPRWSASSAATAARSSKARRRFGRSRRSVRR